MEEDQFILLSMKDSKVVADALSNKTAQKILSYITENNEATESELAEKLETPLPTIHYNIQQLKEANLVKSREFFWSKKGKKMRVFTLAKKYIIISPDKSKSTLQQLKGLLPVTLISMVGAGIIYLLKKPALASGTFDTVTAPARAFVGQELAEKTADTAMATTTDQLINNASLIQNITEPNYALWFLLGSLFTVLVMFIITKIKGK